MPITSGKVLFGRVKKDDDYGINRRADVELSFTVEGEPAEKELGHAGVMAVAKVHELLDLPVKIGQRHEGTTQTAEAAPAHNDKNKLAAAITGAPTSEAVVAPKRAPGRPKKAEAAPAADPSEVTEEAPAAAPEAAADPAEVTEGWEAEAPEITDVDLTGACSRAAKEIGDTKMIKELIFEFAGGKEKGKQVTLREIPQAVRAQFQARLKKLVEAAIAKK